MKVGNQTTSSINVKNVLVSTFRNYMNLLHFWKFRTKNYIEVDNNRRH